MTKHKPPTSSGRTLPLLVGVAALGLVVLLFASGLLDSVEDRRALGFDEQRVALAPPSSGTLEGAAGEPGSMSPSSGREEASVETFVAAEDDRATIEPIQWSGRVLSRLTQEPLGGATLVLHGESSRRRAGKRSEASTDEHGEFDLTWSAAGAAALEIAQPGYATLRLPRVDFGTPGLFELDPAGELVVLVSGPSPDELEAASASLWDLAVDSRTRGAPQEAEADAEGAFRFGELSAGEYSVGVSVPGWSLAFEHRVLVETGQRVDLLLEPARGATLRGKVRWEKELTPVVGAELSFRPEKQGTSSTVEELAALEAETDASGSFELLGLSVGSGKLSIETAGGSRLYRTVFVAEAGKQFDLEFELARPGSVAGRVLNSSGQGVAGAEVSLTWRNTTALDQRDLERTSKDMRRVECDLNGRFLIEEVPAGRNLDVGAQRTSAASDEVFGRARLPKLRSGEQREDVEIHVIETSSVAGVVRSSDGAPIEKARLRATRLGRSSTRWSEALSEADGSFELQGLLPGKYRIDARDASRTPADERHLDAREDIEVTLLASPQDLELELESAQHLAGLVVDEWGAAVPRARVRAKLITRGGEAAPRDRRTSADEFGRFELTQLREGEYELSATASGYSSSMQPVLVELPGALGPLLVLSRKPLVERAVLYGRARDEHGNAPIDLRLTDTRGGSLVQTGESFRLSGVRPGRPRLEFRAKDQLPLRLEPIDIAPGAELDLGELRFERAGELHVFVKSTEGAPLTGFSARLSALPVDKGGRGGRGLRLKRERTRHRWEKGGPVLNSEVAQSSRVPLAKWRLIVDRKGFKRATRTITLTAARPKRTLTITLEPQ